MCLEINKLDPAKFTSALILVWQASFKKTEVKLDLLTDVDMLLMVEKGISGGICHAVHRYAKANNNYMRDNNENEESSYINYWYVNNLNGWTISQELPRFNLEWVKDNSQFNEVFIKDYDEKGEVGYILEVDVKYSKELYELYGDFPFLPKRKKLEKFENLISNLQDKSEYVTHIKS